LDTRGLLAQANPIVRSRAAFGWLSQASTIRSTLPDGSSGTTCGPNESYPVRRRHGDSSEWQQAHYRFRQGRAESGLTLFESR
jgi:hypothetical protein